MIEKDTSKRVLTIGCQWKKPKGGIAVVLNSYSRIYLEFNIIVNSNGKNAIANLLQLLYSLVMTTAKLAFCRDIKIVHIHTASYNSFKRSALFISLAKYFKRKVVVHIHGGGFKEYYEKNTSFVHKNLLKCDTIIALTEYWKEYFNGLGFGNVTIVPNIVDSPVRQEKKNNDGKVHILYLGLIAKAKGIYDLLDVINEHKTEFDGKITLHIGGNGETTTILNIIKEQGLSNIVKFEGWVSGDKKVELLNNADVFILPSYTEGLPISILEAMSYKLPVISTPVGGIPEVIKDGKNGFLFTPGDKDALYQAIGKLTTDKGLREEMGEKSYKKVQPHFPKSISLKLKNIYQEVLKQ